MATKLSVKVKKKNDNALKKLEDIANSISKGQNNVKVGLPRGSNAYPDGTSVVMVGAVHEFGSPSRNIPQRSFLRATLVENRDEYKRVFKSIAEKIMGGTITMEQGLQLLGLKVSSDVKKKITDLKSPALVSREGNPLVDTGHLRQSITYEVDK